VQQRLSKLAGRTLSHQADRKVIDLNVTIRAMCCNDDTFDGKLRNLIRLLIEEVSRAKNGSDYDKR
jgi:hypothetical protein